VRVSIEGRDQCHLQRCHCVDVEAVVVDTVLRQKLASVKTKAYSG
jgi:hypothetical protein